MAVPKIIVSNMTRKTQIVKSHDGDSVQIPPNAKEVAIHEKFDWNLPTTVQKPKEQVVSTNEPIVARSNIEELKRKIFAKRNGGNTIEPVATPENVPEPVPATVNETTPINNEDTNTTVNESH